VRAAKHATTNWPIQRESDQLIRSLVSDCNNRMTHLGSPISARSKASETGFLGNPAILKLLPTHGVQHPIDITHGPVALRPALSDGLPLSSGIKADRQPESGSHSGELSSNRQRIEHRPARSIGNLCQEPAQSKNSGCPNADGGNHRTAVGVVVSGVSFQLAGSRLTVTGGAQNACPTAESSC